MQPSYHYNHSHGDIHLPGRSRNDSLLVESLDLDGPFEHTQTKLSWSTSAPMNDGESPRTFPPLYQFDNHSLMVCHDQVMKDDSHSDLLDPIKTVDDILDDEHDLISAWEKLCPTPWDREESVAYNGSLSLSRELLLPSPTSKRHSEDGQPESTPEVSSMPPTFEHDLLEAWEKLRPKPWNPVEFETYGIGCETSSFNKENELVCKERPLHRNPKTVDIQKNISRELLAQSSHKNQFPCIGFHDHSNSRLTTAYSCSSSSRQKIDGGGVAGVRKSVSSPSFARSRDSFGETSVARGPEVMMDSRLLSTPDHQTSLLEGINSLEQVAFETNFLDESMISNLSTGDSPMTCLTFHPHGGVQQPSMHNNPCSGFSEVKSVPVGSFSFETVDSGTKLLSDSFSWADGCH